MSVPTWGRDESAAEYVYELFELNKRVGQIVSNHPKKYRGSYGDHLIKSALKALFHAQAAQAIFMCETTSEEDYLSRRKHLQNAYAYTKHIGTAMDVYLTLVWNEDGVAQDKINDQHFEIGSRVGAEAKLLHGVMDSDKAIFNGTKRPKTKGYKR